MRMLRTLQLERIAVLQPVVRHLALETVLDLLLEHTVGIADAAAVSVVAARCERVEEAGGQSSETAVAESRIRLLVLKHVDVEPELLQSLAHAIVLAEV